MATAAAVASWSFAGAASALDKQGSAHGGSVSGAESGVAITGSVLGGVAFYNPSYAARPDNTGRALGRVAPHFDFDLIGRRLSIPLDLNVFTDGMRSGVGALVPSELDVITGLTTTWALAMPLALEFGARVERDMPVDRTGLEQSYADSRLRLLYGLNPLLPGLDNWLGGSRWGGSATLGWFAWNPTYAARPDNSGLALFRYALGTAFSTLDNRLNCGIDAIAFTDRHSSALSVSELDASVSVTYAWDELALTAYFERDMPVDRRGLIQQLAMLTVSFAFEIYSAEVAPDRP